MSDRIGVMYYGKLVELANSDDLLFNSLHPYTKLLISSVLSLESEKLHSINDVHATKNKLNSIESSIGCQFRERCPYTTKECRELEPSLKMTIDNHFVACHNIY